MKNKTFKQKMKAFMFSSLKLRLITSMTRWMIISLFVTNLGCASLRSVSISSLPAQRNRIVIAEASKISLFKINFENSYVDGMVQQLIDQCPNGSVEGILTKEEKIHYIYFILEETRVTAKGYCNAKI